MSEICNYSPEIYNTFLRYEPNFVHYNLFTKNKTHETKNIFTNRNHYAAGYIYDWL